MKGVFPVVRWFLEQETWRIPEIFPASRDAAGLWREAELLGAPTPLAMVSERPLLLSVQLSQGRAATSKNEQLRNDAKVPRTHYLRILRDFV